MKRLQRKTNPGIAGGKVQKKNRTDRSATYESTSPGHPVLHRLRPGFGYRHILRRDDVRRFVRLLPHWEELSRGLAALLLAPGRRNCDGWHRPGVVAVCAWERGLWQEVSGQWHAQHRSLFERLEVPCEEAADGYVLCRFTEATVRAYQLLHVLLHELGHHHDRMTTRSRTRSCRGEGYAEAYAWEQEPLVWDRYVRTFGLY